MDDTVKHERPMRSKLMYVMVKHGRPRRSETMGDMVKHERSMRSKMMLPACIEWSCLLCIGGKSEK